MQKTIKQEKKSAKPYYGVSILWIIAALFFPMHKGSTYLLLTIASFIVFFGMKKILPKEYEEVVVYVSETGNEEYDALLNNANSLINSLETSIQAIVNTKAYHDFNSILQSSKAIIAHLTKNPQQINKGRKFFTYYLPTVVKLANTYAHFVSLPVQEDNIKDSIEDIHTSLPMIEETFRKLLDSLFTNHNIDISSDLAAFETVANLDVNLNKKGESIYETK